MAFLDDAGTSGGTNTTLSADAGALTLTGQAISFGLSGAISNGVITFTGQDVSFTHQTAGAYSITIEPGTISFSAPEAYSALSVNIEPGILAFNGQDVDGTASGPIEYSITIEPGTIQFNGLNVNLIAPGSLGEGDKYTKLRLLGYEGTINDMLLKYWINEGAPADSTYVSAQINYLGSYGFETGALNDRWKGFYNLAGYTGSLPDMEYQYWWNL